MSGPFAAKNISVNRFSRGCRRVEDFERRPRFYVNPERVVAFPVKYPVPIAVEVQAATRPIRLPLQPLNGCATWKWRSCSPAALPVVLKAAVELTTPESQDCIGATHGPEHARLFEAVSDDRLAAGFDNTGANEQMLFAELGIVHTSGVGGKVVGVVADLVGQFGIGGLDGTEAGDQFGDLAFASQRF